jgi:hypothetical protein
MDHPEGQEIGPAAEMVVEELIPEEVQNISHRHSQTEVLKAGLKGDPAEERDVFVPVQNVEELSGGAVVDEFQELLDAQPEAAVEPEIQEMIQVDENSNGTARDTGNPGAREQPQDDTRANADRNVLIRFHIVFLYRVGAK